MNQIARCFEQTFVNLHIPFSCVASWRSFNSTTTTQFVSPHRETDAGFVSEKIVNVCVLGYPNAGKSELTNRLVGSKVSAVSSKRSTTTSPHLGAFTCQETQVVLHDTPGVVLQHDIEHRGQVHNVKNAWLTAADSDVLLFLVDAFRQFKHKPKSVYDLAARIARGPDQQDWSKKWVAPPAVLVLNKTDLLPENLAGDVGILLQERFQNLHTFTRCFHISARTGEGVEELRQYLISKAKPGMWLLPKGQSTDLSAGELAVELVREKLYRRLNSTLPYEIEPRLVSCRDLADGSLKIQVLVPVRRASVRRIVVGTGGSVVEQYVRARAQGELQEILRRPVVLLVDVKVEKP